jgi:non-ribosomal peptide synthetase component E (peptide arylation enzyme)|tara:strand:+ start:405 stop:2012 length:1608 start_codon:yes stop_codon:yes gene_type:complete
MTDLSSALNYSEKDRKEFLDAGWWNDDTPNKWVAKWAVEKPDAPIAISMDQTISYEEVREGAIRFGAGLLGLGFKKGDVIGFQLPNIPEILIAYLGIQTIGAVPSLMHMPYRATELEPLLNHVEAKGVVCLAASEAYDAPATFEALKAAAPSLETVIVVGGDAPSGAVSYADLVASDTVEITAPPSVDDPAMILFTSGTSSAPKAVVHSYRTIMASARFGVEDMAYTPEDVVMCAPSFTHAFGVMIVLSAIVAGAASPMMPVYTPPILAELIKYTKATALCCGPAHVLAGKAGGLWDAEYTETLKYIYMGGAVCSPEVMHTIEEFCPNGKAIQIWGMTETLMPILLPLDASFEDRKKYLGTPPIGHEVRSVDEKGNILGPGEEGELEYRGPFLFASYYLNDKANASSFADDGWFKTGDMVIIDAGDHVAMTGRVKDVINRGGIKINPLDIEILMDERPDVLQSAVVPMPDELLGEKACLFLVMAPEKTMALDDMKSYLGSKNIMKTKWPERLEIVEAMPLTATRKVIKGKLVEML